MNLFLPHDGIQIDPGRIDSFTPDIFIAVQHTIKNLDPKVGHTNFVNIRKAHGKTYLYCLRILHDGIDLAADISGRFFYLHKNFIT